MSNIRIDPVRATLNAVKNNSSAHYSDSPACGNYRSGDIHELGDICYGICGAFSGTNDVYNMDPGCTKACDSLIDKERVKLYDVSSCDHQAPYRPVLWEQTSHFFPSLLKSGLSPLEAKDKCLQLCQTNEECKRNCLIDSDAVYVKPIHTVPSKKPKRPIKEGFTTKKTNSATIFICSVLAILLIILLYKCART